MRTHSSHVLPCFFCLLSKIKAIGPQPRQLRQLLNHAGVSLQEFFLQELATCLCLCHFNLTKSERAWKIDKGVFVASTRACEDDFLGWIIWSSLRKSTRLRNVSQGSGHCGIGQRPFFKPWQRKSQSHLHSLSLFVDISSRNQTHQVGALILQELFLSKVSQSYTLNSLNLTHQRKEISSFSYSLHSKPILLEK